MSADQLARALEDAISSLTYIANTACKRDEELMADAINVRGYARSRATAAEQALAAHRAQAGEVHPVAVVTSFHDLGGEYELLSPPTYRPPVGAKLYASPHQVAQWQPIETAPKDGTEVFVYVAGDSLFPTAAAYKSADHFEKEYGDREYMEEGWYWAFGYPSDFHECVIAPTHWMPLPAAPTKEPTNG